MARHNAVILVSIIQADGQVTRLKDVRESYGATSNGSNGTTVLHEVPLAEIGHQLSAPLR